MSTTECQSDLNIENKHQNTKTMKIINGNVRKTMNITVNSDILEQVTSFTHLRHIITGDARGKIEIKNKV